MSTSRVGNDPDTVEAGPEKATVQTIVRDYVTKLRGGDLGSLPAVLGLVVLFLVFTALKPDRFPSQLNVANLTYQAAAIVVLSMGLVFVLLLGEIDLSAGFIGGTSAAVTGVVMTEHGWPWIPSLLACLATGAAIGAVIGLLVARLGIPSFVVTLAFFLGLQGVLLVIIGEGGTIGYENEVILALNNDPMPVWLGWALAVVGLAAFAGLTWLSDSRRRKAGLEVQPVLLWAMKTVGLSRPGARLRGLPVRRARPATGAEVDQGRAPRRRDRRRTPGGADLRAQAHPVGPPHLRRRRQRRGRPTGGHQRPPGQAHLLHHDRDARGVRRPAHRQPQQLGVDEHRWRHDPAVRRGCGRDRRHQPVRRQGPRVRRRHRRLW